MDGGLETAAVRTSAEREFGRKPLKRLSAARRPKPAFAGKEKSPLGHHLKIRNPLRKQGISDFHVLPLILTNSTSFFDVGLTLGTENAIARRATHLIFPSIFFMVASKKTITDAKEATVAEAPKKIDIE